MALDVKIKTNSKAFEKRFQRLQSKFPKIIDKGILQGGFQLLDIIRTKTQKGIDFRGRKFAPYSEGYLKKLQREGKRTNVDLFYTGRMLSALTPSSKTVKKSGKNKISISFSKLSNESKSIIQSSIEWTKKESFLGLNE